jgi:hypothetical protein
MKALVGAARKGVFRYWRRLWRQRVTVTAFGMNVKIFKEIFFMARTALLVYSIGLVMEVALADRLSRQ